MWRIRRRLVEAIRRRQPRAKILIEGGPGRAYCCVAGIWFLRFAKLADVRIAPGVSAVVLMDLGNDLFYGVSPSELIETLDGISDRARRAGARVAVVPLFESPLRSIGPWRYSLLRTFFYPSSKLSWDELQHAVQAVNAHLAARHDAGDLRLIEGMDKFLGPDKIHFLWRGKAAARIAEHLVRTG